MATNAPGVTDPTLQKLVDLLIDSTRFQDGSAPDPAPDAFKDRLGTVVTPIDTNTFDLLIKVNPDGKSAACTVLPVGSRASAITGVIDLATLATKLV